MHVLVREKCNHARWGTVYGLRNASKDIDPAYRINLEGGHATDYQIIATTPDAGELTRPDEPVTLGLYVSEAMDGKHLIKGFPNTSEAIAFVTKYEDDILRAFFLYGEVNGNELPSDIEGAE